MQWKQSEIHCIIHIWWQYQLLSGKKSACQYRRNRRCSFNPWVGKTPCRRKWQPTPVFLPGKPHGQRSLAVHSPWGRRRVRHDLATKQQPPQMWWCDMISQNPDKMRVRNVPRTRCELPPWPTAQLPQYPCHQRVCSQPLGNRIFLADTQLSATWHCSSFHRHPFLSEPHPESNESLQMSWWAHCGRTSGGPVTAGNQPWASLHGTQTARKHGSPQRNSEHISGRIFLSFCMIIPRLCAPGGKHIWLQDHNTIRILTRL